jgi:hypothetical protein
MGGLDKYKKEYLSGKLQFGVIDSGAKIKD